MVSTSIGCLARVRAQGRELWVREGDELADGDVDLIGFASPSLAYIRFRQELPTTIPGIPYRGIAWQLEAVRPVGSTAGAALPRDLPAIGLSPSEQVLARRLLDPMPEGADAIGSLVQQTLDSLPDFPAPALGDDERRDPFLDLERIRAAPFLAPTKRFEGITGLTFDELDVRSIWSFGRMHWAEIGVGPRRFLLRSGDELWDAQVDEILPRKGVVFKQWVSDPMAFRPFRRVVAKVDPRRVATRSRTPPKTRSAMPRQTVSDHPHRSGPRWRGRPPHPPYTAARQRDPFALPEGEEVPEAARPSALSGLACRTLFNVSDPLDRLDAVLERAERRLDQYRRERGWILQPGASRESWVESVLAELEDAVGTDLARLLGAEIPTLRSLTGFVDPSPVEMLSLVGDLYLVAGRPKPGAAAYQLAETLSPAYEPLCGRLYGGKLYGVESLRGLDTYNGLAWPMPTGYFLAWDVGSDRVLERHLLPELPEAVRLEGDGLHIRLTRESDRRLVAGRLEPGTPVSNRLGLRYLAAFSGLSPANHFLRSTVSETLAAGLEADPRLPLTLDELETALRHQQVRDPTRPWPRFLLGHVLWRRGLHAEAEAAWDQLSDAALASVPYYELAWMATLHEALGRSQRSERLYGLAFEARQRLADPPRFCSSLQREVNAAWSLQQQACKIRGGGFHRAWQRVVALEGLSTGDAFRSALWLEELRRSDAPGALAQERELFERARRHPFDPTLASAWVDYSLYLAVSVLATLFAAWVVLVGRWDRSSPRWRRSRIRTVATRGIAALVASSVVLHLAVSLPLLAASDLAFRRVASSSATAGREPATTLDTLADRSRLAAWLRGGVVLPPEGSPARWMSWVEELESLLPTGRLLWTLLSSMVLATLAWPLARWLRRRGALRKIAARLPGAAWILRGAELRGLAIFGLSLFALLPLVWLAIARPWAELPSPGPVAASFFPTYQLEASAGLPPFEAVDDAAPPGHRWQSTGYFLRLLRAYPAADLFWSSVVVAWMLVLVAWCRGTRSEGSRPGGLGRRGGVGSGQTTNDEKIREGVAPRRPSPVSSRPKPIVESP